MLRSRLDILVCIAVNILACLTLTPDLTAEDTIRDIVSIPDTRLPS